MSLQVHAVGAYEEPLKTLILAKNRSDYEASAYLGSILWQHSVLPSLQVDYLIPVPLHPRKQAQRGYNQALVMAQEVSNLTHIPILDCTIRIRNTPQQSRFSRIERYANIQGAFQATAQASGISGKRILLIDDMMTTGATLVEVARALVAYKPVSIQGIVVSGPCE